MIKLWMTLVIVLLYTSRVLAGVEIDLPRSVAIDSEYMKLSDVASVTGDNAAKIKSIFLGPSPRKGTSMSILRSDILARLKDIGLGRDVTFVGTMGVSVTRHAAPAVHVRKVAAEKISGAAPVRMSETRQPEVKEAGSDKYEKYLDKVRKAEVSDLIRRAIKEYAAGICKTDVPVIMETNVNRFELDGTTGDTARVEGLERGKLPGRATLALVFSKDGKVSGYASVDVTIRMECNILVPARNIRKGELVREQDLTWKRVSYRPGDNPEEVRPQDIVGRMALKQLREGMPVNAAYFGKPLDVEKGEMVTVEVQGRGFSIKEMALALGSGNTGDTIKVESVVNKSVYPVRITGRNTADMPVNTL